MTPMDGFTGDYTNQNPYTLSNFMYGSPYLMPGMFLPPRDDTAGTWVFQPSYLASIPRGLAGYNLPYGVTEGEYLGANTQYFLDTTAIGAAHAANFLASTFLGNFIVEKIFRKPLLSPIGIASGLTIYSLLGSAFDKLYIKPFEDAIRYGELYRQATSPIAIFSKDYDPLRQGIKRSSVTELLKEVVNLSGQNYYLDFKDYNTLVIAASQTGILDATAGDVEQIKKAIKSLSSGLKLYASLAKDPTIVDSMKELAQLANMGVSLNDLVNLGTTFAMWAKEAGYNYNQIAPYAQQSAMQYYGMGISPIHAMTGYMRNLLPVTAYSISLQQQGSPLLGMFGGKEGILQQITSVPVGLMQSPLGQFYLAGLTNQQLFSGTISPSQVSDIFAFSNFNASIAMAHPFRTGIEAIEKTIQLVKEATGTTNYFVLKNVLQQMGMSPQQVDTIMYMALDANKRYQLEMRAASNAFTMMVDEYAIQNYPSILRRAFTRFKSFYHTITNPARDFAISLQEWYEDTINRFYYAPYENLSLFEKILYPVFKFFKPGLDFKNRPISYGDYVSDDEVFRFNKRFLRWIDSNQAIKANRYAKYLDTVERLHADEYESNFIKDFNADVDETSRYVFDGNFLTLPIRAMLALPKNIGLLFKRIRHDAENFRKELASNILIKSFNKDSSIFKPKRELTKEDLTKIIEMVESGKPNKEVLNLFLPDKQEVLVKEDNKVITLADLYKQAEKEVGDAYGDERLRESLIKAEIKTLKDEYINKGYEVKEIKVGENFFIGKDGNLTEEGKVLFEHIKNKMLSSGVYDIVKEGRVAKLTPIELVYYLEENINRYNRHLSNITKHKINLDIDKLKIISSAVEGVTFEKGAYKFKDQTSREKLIQALKLLYGDEAEISQYITPQGELTEKGIELINNIRKSEYYINTSNLDLYKKTVIAAAAVTATKSTFGFLGNILEDVYKSKDIKNKEQFKKDYEEYKKAVEEGDFDKSKKFFLKIVNKDIDWNKLEKDESIDPYLKELLKSPEERRDLQNYLVSIGVTNPELFKDPNFLHSTPIVHKLREFAERKHDYEIQKELISSLDSHTVRSLELNAQLLKYSMRESLDGALSKFSVKTGDDALKVVIVGDEINHAGESKPGFTYSVNIGANVNGG